MRWMLGLVCAVVCASGTVFGHQPAEVGSAFADIYHAFAPLAVFHRSYADHLFYGTNVVIPDSLASACDETSHLLALLSLDLVMQTDSQVAATMPWLARVRVDAALFCDTHREVLRSIGAMESPEIDRIKEASDQGLFAEIYHLQDGLAIAFDEYLNGLAHEKDTWAFAVAFALRTVLEQWPLSKLEPNLPPILYGSEQATTPPEFVPEEIAAAIDGLVALVEMPLDETDLESAKQWAQQIYRYVMELP